MICIYCKSLFENAPLEHFIPQCIGGKTADTIECVCGNCNHELGSSVDGLIKKNKILSMIIDSSTLKSYWELETSNGIEKRKVKIVDSKTNKLEYDDHTKGGHLKVKNFKLTIPPEDDLTLYKVFSKILLGFIAYKYGVEEALKQQYDHLRNLITSKIKNSDKIEFKQLSTDFSRDATKETINKITFYWDTKYNNETKQVEGKKKEILINYKLGKSGLCNFIALSNYESNSIIGVVSLLEKKSAMIIIKNCYIPENRIYFRTFQKVN